MGRHAYLIAVHNNPNQLMKLVKALDEDTNDLYIHVDQKAKQIYDCKKKHEIVACAQKSNVHFLSRSIRVEWGQFSQVQFKLDLLQAAVSKGPYEYYHHISGQDFPLKPQDYIHNFFAENSGKEFISFENGKNDYTYRIKYYYDFLKGMGRPSNKIEKMAILFYAGLQHTFFGIDRTQELKDIEIKKGGAWFSITEKFAKYVISQRDWIEATFSSTYCGDEMFLQTLIWNSCFRNNLFRPKFGDNGDMRLIDWNRGHPYIFREDDFEELKNSRCLWARKFDENVDEVIIDKLAILLSRKRVNES